MIAGEIMMCDGPCQRAFHYGIEPRYYWTNTEEEVPPDAMPEELEVQNQHSSSALEIMYLGWSNAGLSAALDA